MTCVSCCQDEADFGQPVVILRKLEHVGVEGDGVGQQEMMHEIGHTAHCGFGHVAIRIPFDAVPEQAEPAEGASYLPICAVSFLLMILQDINQRAYCNKSENRSLHLCPPWDLLTSTSTLMATAPKEA